MTGWSTDGVDLDSRGHVGQPVLRLDLDAWNGASLEVVTRTATRIRETLPITIGVAASTPSANLAPIIDALSLTLVGPDAAIDSAQVVGVADPEAAYAELVASIGQHPQTAVALGQLLRQTPQLSTTAGLAAEAAVYSMLLGGAEFASWLAATDRPARATAQAATIRVVRSEQSLNVILDRPSRRNALSFQMREELLGALELALLDEQIERVELSGAGPAFCSGGDLAEFGTAEDFVAAYLVRLDRAPGRLLDQLRGRLGADLTVTVHGAAIGAGVELAAFGGHVACTPETVFCLPEVAMGLVPGAGGTVSVVRRIGRWRAAWAMLGGAQLDAATALAWGLVDEIVMLDPQP